MSKLRNENVKRSMNNYIYVLLEGGDCTGMISVLEEREKEKEREREDLIQTLTIPMTMCSNPPRSE